MRQYNAFQAIYMSFYSRDLYRDVAKNWNGYAILYLLLILALSWVVLTFTIQRAFEDAYYKNIETLVPQIPILTIKKGIISTPENRPYLIKHPKSEQLILVIDTTGKYKTLDEAKSMFLVTQNAVISKPKPNEIRIDQIPTSANAVVDPAHINEHILKKYLPYAWVILFPAFLLFSFVFRLIQAVVYAILGKLFSSMSRVQLTYGQIILISIVAITPVIVVSTLFDFFGIIFIFQGLFYFLLAMIYLIFGIKANKTVYSESSNSE